MKKNHCFMNKEFKLRVSKNYKRWVHDAKFQINATWGLGGVD